jgi:hypothetical protein
MIDDKGISQTEKREVLKNDQRVRQGSTYFHHAQGIDLEMGGRFSKVHPTTVTGSTPGHNLKARPGTVIR